MPIDIRNTKASRKSIMIENVMRGFGRKSTLWVGRHFGEYFPYYYVAEYPKSGGTWLGKMCGSAFDVPFPQHPVFPVGMEAVIHTHSSYDPKLKHVNYLVRDGRDVMLSFYFHRARTLKTKYRTQSEKWLKKVYGLVVDMDDVEAHLYRFIEHEMEQPSVIGQNWPDHVTGWLNKPNVTLIRYEDLLTDPVTEMLKICNSAGHKQIDSDTLEAIVERYSFSRMSGRKAGKEDRGSFLRKGVAGDWVNYYDAKTLELFEEYAGGVLKKLNYI